LGIVIITRSFLAKNYPSELVFELISLLVVFIIFTPLTSFAILARKGVHENELYGIPFLICGFVSFIPGIFKIILLTQNIAISQVPTIKMATLVVVALFVLTMIIMLLIPSN